MTVKRAKKPKKNKVAPLYRLMAIGPYSQSSLGVYHTKAEASAFKKRTRAAWREPKLKKLMRDMALVIEPLSPDEIAEYLPQDERAPYLTYAKG
jgi:hypothetical protein